MSSQTHAKHEEGVPIVGIGASAGGLESLERFFEAAEPGTGIAYVVVQHLSPDFRSMMDQLLARRTRLRVETVTSGVTVQPDTVYLLPPGKLIVIVDDALVLTDKGASKLTLPVDRFFESLARGHGCRAAGVVLSGTGSDGAAGVRLIKERGGVVLAESHTSAKFSGMPRSAIETRCVDAILAPEDMPAALGRAFAGEPLRPVSSRGEGDLSTLLAAISARHDTDFREYKHSTLMRRLSRRADLMDVSVPELVRQALEETSLLDELSRDFLINVTRFFRDTESYEVLAKELRSRLAAHDPSQTFRVWSAGCATGEEPYSLAMLLLEIIDELDVEVSVKVFATDLSRDAIREAAAGVYAEDRLLDVSAERLDAFFVRHPMGYVVDKRLRGVVVFSPHDVLHDAPFTSLDLVVCRNLLIYLQRAAQEKALSYFHFGLRPSGLLFLGPSETTDQLGRAFEALDHPSRIYEKQPDRSVSPAIAQRHRLRQSPPPTPVTSVQLARARHAELSDLLCQTFMPPSIVLDARRNVLSIYGGAERFLSVKGGLLSVDFFDLLDAELKGTVAGALRVLEREGDPIVVRSVRAGAAAEVVDLRLRSVRVSSGEVHHVVSFHESARDVDAEGTDFRLGAEQDATVAEIEAELGRTRAHLQSAVEELEAANEELQATNEELVSSNEELQSTNEELSSVNEELFTVNTEYQQSNASLRQLNTDFRELLDCSDLAILFLDGDLGIRRYTPRIAQIIRLQREDVGRRVTSFSHTLRWRGFYDALVEVAGTGKSVERETFDGEGKRVLVRISAYAREEDEPDGVVVTVTDINALARARAAIRDRERRLGEITNALPVLIAHVDGEQRYTFVNDAYVEVFQRDRAEIVGRRASELLTSANYGSIKPHLEAALQGQRRDFEMDLHSPGGDRHATVSYVPHTSEEGAMLGVFVAVTDITERRRMELELEQARHEARLASNAKSDFLASVSHEIRTPMTAISGFAELLAQQRLSDGARRFTDAIVRNSRHLISIVNDVLDLSRIEQGSATPRLEPCSIAKLAAEVHETIAMRAEPKGLAVELDLPPELPDPIVSDPMRLRQILINLGANAVKFTDEGRVCTRVRILDAAGTPRLRVAVEDTGIGFSPDAKEALFEPFTRLEGGSTREGSGLGLAISARLAGLLQGSLDADGAPGKGACFTLTVPIEIPADASWVAGNGLPEVSRHGPDELPQLSGHILVVDDSADVRNVLRDALRAAGATVTMLASGQAALDRFEADGDVPFDAVLMDIQMPGIDGLVTTARLRKLGVRLPIVALTARALEIDEAACAEAGCSDYMPKPVSLVELLDKLQRLLQPTPFRVLVVEDNEDNAELLVSVMKAHGLDATYESSVDDALQRVEEQRPDAIVSDLNLRDGGHGTDLAARLRAGGSDLTLVALSGADEQRERALAAGFDHFMLKPYDVDELLGLVRRPRLGA